jgi:hypothetical protein
LNTRTITLIVVFAALALVLSPIRIPTFFWPGQYFRLWEIPIIVAFFLFGFKVSFAATLLYAVGYVTIIPDGSGIVGLPWVIVLMLSVFLGLLLARKIGNRNISEKEKRWMKPIVLFTTFGVLSRVAIMPFVDYGVYRFLLPFVIGRTLPNVYIMGLMPAIVFFNIVVPLYTIPIAYVMAKTIEASMKIGKVL